jgi:hypothetical protein
MLNIGDRVEMRREWEYQCGDYLQAGELGTVTYVGEVDGDVGVEVLWDLTHRALSWWDNHLLIVEPDTCHLKRAEVAAHRPWWRSVAASWSVWIIPVLCVLGIFEVLEASGVAAEVLTTFLGKGVDEWFNFYGTSP